jgi:hypothetical protein
MSRLQTRVKPHLVPLIEGRWSVLTDEAQATLAAWATLFSIVHEYADPPTAAVPQEQRSLFMERQAPPPGWTIWMGYVQLDGRHPGTANHHGCVGISTYPDGLPKPLYFQSTGFTVGTVFFQTVLFSESSGIQYDPDAVANECDLRTIHPFRGAIDLAPRVLNWQALEGISNAFAHALGMPFFVVP